MSEPAAEPVVIEAPKSSDRRTDLIGGTVLIVIATFMLVNAGEGIDWTFPVALAWILVATGVFLVVRGLVKIGRSKAVVGDAGMANDKASRDPVVGLFAVVGIVYVLLIEPVGFWAASALLIFGSALMLRGERPTRRSVSMLAAVSVGTCVVGYVMLQYILLIPLPNGILDSILP
jgi:hypothetical protein